ncbi:hypothetical protein CANCADRAFT_4111 [Tortispora caseinolytica NRRL Y-17796]|uniref:SAP domain-containing protein n=1 Tax=Tortispora caseinolytica NRRL Y-17796 TaxID=767744 RepID=A0A1E4TCL2_9ASCO|nr:hypothetical protein CANCADRAFT_4111 [Tortispora caseinolytica NRRL Y-17796]
MTEYSSLKVTELKDLLKERGLSVNGNKQELVSRLEEADDALKDGPAEASEPQADTDAKVEETATKEAKPEESGEASEAKEPVKELTKEEKEKMAIEELEKQIARSKRFGTDDWKEAEKQIARIKKFGLVEYKPTREEVKLSKRGAIRRGKSHRAHPYERTQA